MNIRQITTVCFSPTGQSRQAAERIAEQLPGVHETLDLTDAVSGRPDYRFTEDEAVVVAAPVYGGRIPSAAVERFRKLKGRSTAAVLVVTYGNRAYEDALAELQDVMVEQGFRPVAAAAVVAEHNIARVYAAGRPDASDQSKLEAFGRRTAEILEQVSCNYAIGELTVKGNRPYRPYGVIPLKIKVGSGCSGCGLCVKKCPVQAISRTDPKVTDETSCIGCMRCVRVCPSGSRKLGLLLEAGIRSKLKKVCSVRKEPEFFYEAGK